MQQWEENQVLLAGLNPNIEADAERYLVERGLRVTVKHRGENVLETLLKAPPDLAVLHLNCGGLSSLEVCRQARPVYTGPLLLICPASCTAEDLWGLELQADEVLVEPVSVARLLMKASSILRLVEHLRRGLQISGTSGVLEIGPLRLNPQRRTIRIDGDAIQLTTAEFELLWLLVRNAGRVLTRDEIYSELRGIDYNGVDRSMDLRVTSLRRKLGNPALIKTVRGVGYLLAA